MTASQVISTSLLRWSDAYKSARAADDLAACAQAFARAAEEEAVIIAAPPCVAKAAATLTIAAVMMRDEHEGGDLPSYADLISASLSTLTALEAAPATN